jgi:CHAT domain-containing protein
MRISRRWRLAFISAFVLLSIPCVASRKYLRLYISRKRAPYRPIGDLLHGPEASRNPQTLLAEANRLAFLFNGPRAEPLYVRAEELFQQRGDARDETYARIGRVSAATGTLSLEEASSLLRHELDLPVMKEDRELRLWCLVSKGYIDLNLNPVLAKRDWMEAQKLAHALGEPMWEARASGELAIVTFLEGNAGRAASMAGDALLSAVATGDVGAQIRYLQLIGSGLNELRRYPEAIALFDRAVKLATSTPGAGFPFMAYEAKADALSGQGRLNDAAALLDKALVVARNNRVPLHESLILLDLGELALQTGNRESGKAYLVESGRIAEKCTSYRGLARAMIELVDVYTNAGDFEAAEKAASTAVYAERRVGDRYFLPRDLTKLANLKARRGRLSEAAALFANAEDIIDGMLVSLHEPYWKSSLASGMSETYVNHFELEVRRGSPERALRVLERIRGRTAAAFLENKVDFDGGEAKETRDLEDTVSDIQLQLMRTEDPQERTNLLGQLVEFERRLEWAQKDRAVFKEQWFEQPASLNSVQAALHADEIVLEYVLDEPRGYCVWISKSKAGVEALSAGRREIEAWTLTYLDEIKAKKDAIDVAKRLYNTLLGPLLGTANAQRVIVVPDGILNFLPFEALRDATGSLVVESRTVSYAPAATVLELLRNIPRTTIRRRNLLGVGDAPYQGQPGVPEKLIKANGVGPRLLRGLSAAFGTRLYDLPQTRKEVLEISKIFGNDSVILVGPDATERAFKAQPLEEFRVIHLAVHGFADADYPQRSALVLGVDPNSHEDGLLQVREITRLHFDSDLVTLSACDTALGKLQGQEGVTSLAEAFLISGSRAVVASLWSADDTNTSVLMNRFYTHIAQGKDKASALREAKLDLIVEYGAELSPYFWAGFILVGDGGSSIQVP